MESDIGSKALVRRSEVLGELEKALWSKGKSQATIRKYVRDAGKYLSYVQNKYGSEDCAYDRIILEEYRDHLLSVYKVTSVNSMIAGINYLLKIRGKEDLKLEACKVQRPAFREDIYHLTKEDYCALASRAEMEGNIRLSLLIQTLASTGIRISELQFITVEALESGRVEVSLKGKTRSVILPGKLCSKLRTYCMRKGRKKGAVFVTRSGRPVDRSNVLHELKRLSVRAGIDPAKVHPHNFRHLFAVTYYGMYKDISNLADILGHSNINTTRIYTALSRAELERSIDNMGML